MNARRRAITAILTGAIALVGCTEDPPAPMQMQPIEGADAATVLAEGGGWMLEYVTEQDCARLRSGDESTFCVSGSDRAGDVFGSLVSGDDRLYVFYSVGTPNGRAKLFSSTGIGVPMVTASMGEVTWAVAELGPGEDPWGIQAFDADGALVYAGALLG